MFRIELELLTGACGTSGETKLKEQFMNILPMESKPVELKDAIQKVNVLQSSRLWQLVSSQAQGLIKSGMRMLTDMSQGECPQLPAGSCQWLVDVYSRLPWFAAVVVEGDASSGGKATTKRGKRAVEHVWGLIKDTDASELSLQELMSYHVCFTLMVLA